MFMRDSRRARFVHLDDTSRESESAPFELRECGPDAENALASGEMKQILATEVRRVPPLLRNVIMLRDIQELPMRAAADTLEISVPAAKSRLLRSSRVASATPTLRDCIGAVTASGPTQPKYPPSLNEPVRREVGVIIIFRFTFQPLEIIWTN